MKAPKKRPATRKLYDFSTKPPSRISYGSSKRAEKGVPGKEEKGVKYDRSVSPPEPIKPKESTGQKIKDTSVNPTQDKNKPKTVKDVTINPYTKTDKEGKLVAVDSFTRKQEVLIDDPTKIKNGKSQDTLTPTSVNDSTRVNDYDPVVGYMLEGRDPLSFPKVTGSSKHNPESEREVQGIIEQSNAIRNERPKSTPEHKVFSGELEAYELNRFKEHYGGMEEALRSMADENGNYPGSDVSMDEFLQTIIDYGRSAADVFINRTLRGQSLRKDIDPGELEPNKSIPTAQRMIKAMDAFFKNPPDHKSFSPQPGRNLLYQNHDFTMAAFNGHNVGDTISDKSYFSGMDSAHLVHNYEHRESERNIVNFKGKTYAHSGTNVIAKLKPDAKVFNTSLGSVMRRKREGGLIHYDMFNNLLLDKNTKFEVLANDVFEFKGSDPTAQKYRSVYAMRTNVPSYEKNPSIVRMLILKQK